MTTRSCSQKTRVKGDVWRRMRKQGSEGGRKERAGWGWGKRPKRRKEEAGRETSHVTKKGRGRQGLSGVLKASSLPELVLLCPVHR